MCIRRWSYISLLICLSAANPAFSAQHMGRGKVDFGGEIVVVPCSLDMSSRHQLIDLGNVNTDQAGILRREIMIKLVDCELANQNKPDFSRVQVAFYGETNGEDSGQLGLKGDAKGLSLYLLNDRLQKINLGQPLNDYEIVAGNNTLRFFTELKVDQQRARAGHFAATVQFVLSYF